jgi:iron(III) transport system permease protein
VDAYTDDKRVIGNTFFAEARQHGMVIDAQLGALVDELSAEASLARTEMVATTDQTTRVALITVGLAVALGALVTWVVLRSKIPGRTAFDFIAFLPHAIPNIVFGVAILLMTIFLVRNAVPLFGTLWILLFVFVIARLSYGTRMTNSTLIQIHRELEEAATMSGVSTGVIVHRILVPLLAPTLIYAWLWIALITFRELTLAVILTTRDNITLPVVVWSMWQAGGFGQAAAITLLLMLHMVPLIALYWWAMRKTGLREA